VSAPTHLVLYDAECRFCRWSLAWVLRWDRRRRLEPVALQDPRAAELLSGMGAAERMASWHLIAPGGSTASAGAAAPHLLRLLPGGSVAAALALRSPGAVERAYAWVAGHRGSLGRGLSDGAVRRADALIAERELRRQGDSRY
jgi:predicted DCC family thiol-disulfide oxidoreductase YuxK